MHHIFCETRRRWPYPKIKTSLHVFKSLLFYLLEILFPIHFFSLPSRGEGNYNAFPNELVLSLPRYLFSSHNEFKNYADFSTLINSLVKSNFLRNAFRVWFLSKLKNEFGFSIYFHFRVGKKNFYNFSSRNWLRKCRRTWIYCRNSDQ